MAGIRDAGNTEYDEDTPTPLIVLASCPVPDRPDDAPLLSGKLRIRLSPDSLAFRIYRLPEITEEFNCNYELNPAYRDVIEAEGLRVSGTGEDGGARIVELPGHLFFLATAFQPQLTSEEGRPHPLITSYLQAASGRT
ncbi:MAG: hypothetical protein H8D49_02365 [Dehalococcoidia bacterium]|nr:hypothetical protein [Dehalococcoidia bacterium]MBL7165908.1 hypothetical protein [Dehalococcoidales bacterium]